MSSEASSVPTASTAGGGPAAPEGDAAGSAFGVAPAQLSENDAAVLDAFVVPSYLRMYWEAARKVLLVGEAARVAHLGCRTGYPDGELLAHMPNTVLASVDPSPAALRIAKSKIGAQGVHYVESSPLGSSLPAENFSHALALHPVGSDMDRVSLMEEMRRLLYPGGQAVLALPLSRSFPEILDLLAEFALKHDATDLGRALEEAAADRVTIETLTEDLENAGLSDVDFELHHDTLGFDSGRAFLEDPATRFLIIPQIAHWLDGRELGAAMDYVAKAIDKYWSEEKMDVTVVIAAMSGRRT